MSPAFKLELGGKAQPKPYMTPQQYREFCEKFQQQVKPDLDKQREARVRSEEAAKRHLVS